MQYPEHIDLPAVIGTCIPIFAILVAIVAILATNWRKAKATECRAVLVQSMIEKGFNASEIERVLRASNLVGELSGGKKGCDC